MTDKKKLDRYLIEIDNGNNSKKEIISFNLNTKNYHKLIVPKEKESAKSKKSQNKKLKKDLENYYHYINILINDKKIDNKTYNIVKDYNNDDLNKLLNNEKYIEYLRNYLVHSNKYESATDKEFVNLILSKIKNQISKGQFADNLNYYSKQKRYNTQ